jgi:hypothetical protein
MNIQATANDAIAAATVTQSTLRAQGDQSGRIDGTYDASSTTFTLDPTVDLMPGETVHVTATNGIQSTGGGSLAPHVWQFTAAGGVATGAMAAHATTPEFGAGSNSVGATLGDLDGDGDLDAVIANYLNEAETVWLNDGTGNFTSGGSFGGGHSQKVALGDLDGDGDLDAVVANDIGGQPEDVWLNDGNGSFTSNGTFGTGTSTDIDLGDVDGDGDLDALVGNAPEGETVWLNDGLGSFTLSATLGTGDTLSAVLGDIDNDGDLDAVVANYLGAHTVWVNDGTGTFSPHSTSSFGSAGFTGALALGDLDGDGDLDGIIANRGTGAEAVWLNDGNGVFTAGATFGASDSQSVTLGDLDGDGDLDAVTANESGQSERVWMNDGNASFTAHPLMSSGFGAGNSFEVALGDLDGDGDLDAVVANYNAQAETVWINRDPPGITVNPTSGVVTTEAGGTDTFTVVLDSAPVADVMIHLASSDSTEADVDPWDLTFTTSNWATPQTVTVTGINDGIDDGNVAYTITTNAATSTDPLYSGLDADDVAASNTDDDTAGVTVFPTTSTVSEGSTQMITVTLQVQPLGDVVIDIASTNTDEVTVSPSQLTFTPSNWSIFQLFEMTAHNDTIDDGNQTTILTISINTAGTADPAYDGVDPPDVAITAIDDEVMYVALTTPDANERAAPRVSAAYANVSGGPLSPTIDGGTVNASTVRVYGDQTGKLPGVPFSETALFGFTPSAAFKPGETISVSATSGVQSTTDIALTPHVWQFTAAADPASGAMIAHATTPSFVTISTTDVAIGDLDGDGDLDALVANNGANAESVWSNDGDGNFTANGTFGDTRASNGVTLGDIDGDGDLDAVIANGTGPSQPETVWLNNGGTFFAHGTFGSQRSQLVALGDLDGDGDLDAFVANAQADPETVFLNDGTGNFSAHPTTPSFGANNSLGVALGDLDNDGDLDAVVANFDDQPESVWLNNGVGAFTAHPTASTFGAGDSSDVALGDLDGDGDLDAVITNHNAEPESVWTNDGTGAFSFHASFGTGHSQDVSLGDLDGDGDLDAAIVNSQNELSTLWLNDGAANLTPHPVTAGVGSDFSRAGALGDLDADGDLDFVVGNPASFSAWMNRDVPGITVTPTTDVVTTEAGGTDTFTVVLDSAPIADVTIDLASSDSSEASVAPLQLTFTTSNWATPQTVTVTGIDDAISDGDIAYTITTSTATSSDALYSGLDAANVSATNTDDDPPAAPAFLTATATSASAVQVNWGAVPGATSYQVYRNTTLVHTTADTSFLDSPLSANTTYLYQVLAKRGSAESPLTPIDAATTIIFTDATLGNTIKIKGVHLTQLRTAVNAVRTAAGLGTATFTDPTITASTRVKRIHIIELRTALDAARAAIGLAALTYTDPTITVGVTKAKAAHFAELRAGTQ